MRNLLFVGIGGFAGALLRYLVSGYIQNLSHRIDFPYGTLAVNLTGCFLIGALSQLVELQWDITAEIRLMLMVGLLGSFTTYSTFGNETLTLIQDQRLFLAAMNIGTHLFFGLLAVLLGQLAVTTLWR
jgi:fluoride exporter